MTDTSDEESFTASDRDSLAMDTAEWVWGVLEGGFNEKQTTSQIIVDAVITLIPVVGDVAVVRDLLACVLRLVNDPSKRASKTEWVQLTLLLFALIPVAGGVIKGVGKLLLKEGSESAKLIAEIVELLNHVGIGDAVKWLKELNLPQYTETLVRKFNELATLFKSVCERIKARMPLLPESMKGRLDQIVVALEELQARATEMIPGAVKELWQRLEAIQKSLYEGQWHAASVGEKTATRTLERKLVKSESAGAAARWEMSTVDFPGLKSIADLPEAKGWPAQRSTTRLTPAELAAACHTVPTPVWLPPGTELVRVISESKRAPGVWWMFKKDLPKNGPDWRNDFAVLEYWSSNGLKVEVTVPEGGAWIWMSQVASQLQTSTELPGAGQYLRGGATQLFLDLDFAAHRDLKAAVLAAAPTPTNWDAAKLVNVGTPEAPAVTTTAVEGVMPKPGVIEQLSRSSRVAASASSNQSQDAHP